MNNENKDFPQYRKHSNGKHFYKITDDKRFQEILSIGSKKAIYKFKATKYPEMLRVKEMLNLDEPYLSSDESEWELFLEEINAQNPIG